ncbi:MAG: RES family NAD+ phosphorylase [Sterolibacteriaceae bacterium]|uniref:RES family NAD+ phosphorylase n=1 Tax=Candidatus Methylophosphatis roskildensis TaxID=2899263 RepID=A0A9D7HLA4_9PROT|nr:RES family NAD+ phosphorylase [Candidatus Methylophosphatis roskildensis]
MLLWRISNHAELSGEGGLGASARWHSAGRRIVYLGQNPATCLLEHLVHLEIDAEDMPSTFRTLKIEVPDVIYAGSETSLGLPNDWQDNIELTQTIGNQWLTDGPLLLRVPCALVPETENVLLNSGHRDAPSIKIIDVIDFPFDQRLISGRS